MLHLLFEIVFSGALCCHLEDKLKLTFQLDCLKLSYCQHIINSKSREAIGNDFHLQLQTSTFSQRARSYFSYGFISPRSLPAKQSQTRLAICNTCRIKKTTCFQTFLICHKLARIGRCLFSSAILYLSVSIYLYICMHKLYIYIHTHMFMCIYDFFWICVHT